jgi:uroporphyrinogen-III decarboxylase
MLHRGCIMVRNDAATNLSPAMYDQFVRPCDRRLFDEFGGGGIHFCGRGDHFIAQAVAIPGVCAVNVTQPHLNDPESIFQNTVDRGIQLIGFERQAAEQALRRGRALRGNVHCW